ncbi:LysR family transcriptional regulator [Brevundimonas phoenicis]|uniref:LysR family transcriptional regulator n=1 Tax=Brevundimonas TaxID=41275 RepID=UPI0039A6E7AD
MLNDLKRLRYLITVIQTGSFTAASEKLNVAQPALSRRISELEASIGLPLLDRSSRPIALTEAGQIFHDRAHLVLHRSDQLETAMKRYLAERRPQFVLGLVPTEFHIRLPQILARFREMSPRADYDVQEMHAAEQVVALKEGHIDVGISRVMVQEVSLTQISLRNEELLLALPIGHQLADQPIVDLDDIRDEETIFYPRGRRPSFADEVLLALLRHDLELVRTREVESLHAATVLVACGIGITFVPGSSQDAPHPGIVLVPTTPRLSSQIYLSHRPDDRSEALQDMLSSIQGAYGDWGLESSHIK